MYNKWELINGNGTDFFPKEGKIVFVIIERDADDTHTPYVCRAYCKGDGISIIWHLQCDELYPFPIEPEITEDTWTLSSNWSVMAWRYIK